MNKMPNAHEAMIALCRKSLRFFAWKAVEVLNPGLTFQPNWHIDALCHEIELMMAGEHNRLITNLPPRYLKSTIVSVAAVAFYLGQNPSLKVMVVSYGDALAVELSTQTRQLMESPFYKAVFPGTKISPTKNTETIFKTTKGGQRYAVSMGGQITGFGADLIIIDDLIKPEDALSEVKRNKANSFFSSTLMSRLNDKKTGKVIIVMQRLHPNDLTGYALEIDHWKHIKFPAIATHVEMIETGHNAYFKRAPGDLLHPDRENQEILDQIKKQLGEHQFAAQYQQLPVLPGGNMLKLHWFKRYDVAPPMHYFECLVQSWDTAVTNAETSNYSVCTTWGKVGGIYYLLDVFRKKMDYPELQKEVWFQTKKWKPFPKLVVIEGSHIGQALMAHYAKGPYHSVFRTLTPKGTKEERAAKQSAKIEAGRVYIPNTAPWLLEFEDEVRQFPVGKYDDQVDSMTQFLGAMDQRVPGVTI